MSKETSADPSTADGDNTIDSLSSTSQIFNFCRMAQIPAITHPSIAKRPRLDPIFTGPINSNNLPTLFEMSLKDVNETLVKGLQNIEKKVEEKLDFIERKIDAVQASHKELRTQIDALSHLVARKLSSVDQSSKNSKVVVGLPCINSDQPEKQVTTVGPNVTLITLNKEEDYPDGCWLGDECNSELRVRVALSPSDLLHINTNCTTAEKMALTLLDYLFDRDTQACSNLSGSGKHGKKQLDPLIVYAIRCHLIYQFNISEMDWSRIKHNIDSKCRTAFRKKYRSQASSYISQQLTAEEMKCQQLHQSLDGSAIDEEHVSLPLKEPAEIISMSSNESYQVVHATSEHMERLQQHSEKFTKIISDSDAIPMMLDSNDLDLKENYGLGHELSVKLVPNDEDDNDIMLSVSSS